LFPNNQNKSIYLLNIKAKKYKRRPDFDNMNTENIIKTLWEHRRKLFTNRIYDKSDSGQMQKNRLCEFMFLTADARQTSSLSGFLFFYFLFINNILFASNI